MTVGGRECIAVFDAGTTAVKVCLFAPDASLLACSVQEYSLDTRGACVEAPAERYLAAVRDGLADVTTRVPDARIAAVGLTTQGETLVPVDRAGEPLRPFLVWLDGRAEDEAAALRGSFSAQDFYEATGLPEATGALPLAKLMWLRRNEPDVFSRTYKFLLLEDYLIFALTGRFVSEPSVQTSSGWFHLGKDGAWDDALRAAGIPAQLLPDVLECGQTAGTVTDEAARRFGLPAGIPVLTGAMDQTAAALAAGCGDGVVTETTGTALVAAACTASPVFSRGHHVTIYRHVRRGEYLYLPIGSTAGMALRWFRDEFCPDLPAGGAGYAALDRMAALSPPGSNGVLFLPYLSGCVDPDACEQAKAVFFGASLSTGRGDFARAVLESTAFVLADFLDMLDALGCPCREVRSLGGGASSALWQQIKADVCGRSLTVPACREATAQGAALLAAWGCGMLPAGEVPQRPAAAVYAPEPGNKEAYRAARERFSALYRAVRPLF